MRPYVFVAITNADRVASLINNIKNFKTDLPQLFSSTTLLLTPLNSPLPRYPLKGGRKSAFVGLFGTLLLGEVEFLCEDLDVCG